MHKSNATWIALGVLAILVAVFFVVREQPVEDVESPLVIKKVKKLSRIEVVPAQSDGGTGDSDSPELIVYQKKDDTWRLTRPVESTLNDKFAENLEEAFAEDIETEDFDLSEDNKADYKLSEDTAVKVALYGGEDQTPSNEILIGKEITVSETNVKRTYVQVVGQDGIYRAQAALGNLFRKPLSEVRSKQILDLNKGAITAIKIDHTDGPTVRLASDGETWSMVEPKVDWKLEKNRVDGVARTLSNLRATGFADGADPSAIGLEPPATKVSIEAGDANPTLLVGSSKADGEPTHYVKLHDGKHIYEVSSRTAEKLTAQSTYFRTRTPLEIDQKTVTRVRFPGEDRVVLEKSDGAWTMTRPQSDEFNESRAKSLVSRLASLRVQSYPDVSAAEAGLAGGDVITIRTSAGTHRLRLGSETEEGNERYGRFDDGPIFTLRTSQADRLIPSKSDLEGSAKPNRNMRMPQKMPPGMGKQLPGNLKMPPGMKQR